MGRVKTETNEYEGTEDTLDGLPLRRGQAVKIKFPDGHTEQATVTITTTTSDVRCHNDRWTEHHTAAYVRIVVHDVGLKIRLAEHNLDVERIK